MPIYDYICSNCRHLTEVIHGINDPGPRFCPSCGAEGTLRKGISSPAVLFKGSGWAKKDRAATRTTAASRSGRDEGSSTDKSDGDGRSAGGTGRAGSDEAAAGGGSGAAEPSAGSDA